MRTVFVILLCFFWSSLSYGTDGDHVFEYGKGYKGNPAFPISNLFLETVNDVPLVFSDLVKVPKKIVGESLYEAYDVGLYDYGATSGSATKARSTSKLEVTPSFLTEARILRFQQRKPLAQSAPLPQTHQRPAFESTVKVVEMPGGMFRLKDTKKPIKQPWEYPSCMNVMIVAGFDALTSDNVPKLLTISSSGAMVSPCVVLTCAHGLYLRHEQIRDIASNFGLTITSEEPSQVAVRFPYEIEGKCQYNVLPCDDFRVSPQWIQGLRDGGTYQDHDFGVLHLMAPLGLKTGYASINPNGNSKVSMSVRISQKLSITGFPSEYKGIMCRDDGELKIVDDHRIHYVINTSTGNSGSLVWVEGIDGIVECVGVHTNGRGFGQIICNSGVYINPAKSSKIKDWLTEFGELRR